MYWLVWVGFLNTSNSSDPSGWRRMVRSSMLMRPPTFEGPFDVLVDGVEEGEEGGDVIAIDSRHGVVSLAEPEEDDAYRGGAGGM
jgi:hypothetical protein